jgi:hypothetical protein
MGGNRQLLVSRPRACARHGARALASGHKDHAGRTLPQKLLLHVLPTLQGPEVTLAHLQPHTSAQTSTNGPSWPCWAPLASGKRRGTHSCNSRVRTQAEEKVEPDLENLWIILLGFFQISRLIPTEPKEPQRWHGHTQPDLENLWIIFWAFSRLDPPGKDRGHERPWGGLDGPRGRSWIATREYTEGCKITLTTISFAPPGEFCGQP